MFSIFGLDWTEPSLQPSCLQRKALFHHGDPFHLLGGMRWCRGREGVKGRSYWKSDPPPKKKEKRNDIPITQRPSLGPAWERGPRPRRVFAPPPLQVRDGVCLSICLMQMQRTEATCLPRFDMHVQIFFFSLFVEPKQTDQVRFCPQSQISHMTIWTVKLPQSAQVYVSLRRAEQSCLMSL